MKAECERLKFRRQINTGLFNLTNSSLINFAQEFQRQVNAFGFRPTDISARAAQLGLQRGERRFNFGGNFDCDKGSHSNHV